MNRTGHDGNETSNSHWSTYWATGYLTSLPEDFKENYSGEIGRFWETVFSNTPGSATILDACTGNGAIALLAANHARLHEYHWAIHAVDAADIQPERIRQSYRHLAPLVDEILFHGKTFFESMSATYDQSLDLIVSQYGIEYCDWGKAAETSFRLLRPQGRLSVVTHAPTSSIISTMSREEQAYQDIEKLGLLKSLDQWIGGESGPDTFRGSLSSFVDSVKSGEQAAGYPLLDNTAATISELLTMDDATLRSLRPRMSQFSMELQHGHARLADLLDVNRAIQRNPDWWHHFTDTGLVLDQSGPIYQDGDKLSGHFYVFVRP